MRFDSLPLQQRVLNGTLVQRYSSDQICRTVDNTIMRLDAGSHTQHGPNANIELRQNVNLTSSMDSRADQVETGAKHQDSSNL